MKRFLKSAIAMWLIVCLLLGAIPEVFASSAAGAIEALAEEAQAHPAAEDSALAANAKEQDEATDGDGWIYRIGADGYAELIGCADASATALALPTELGGAWVVRLAEDAFAENEALRSVTIPAQIGEIPDSAFPNQQHMTVHALNGTAALAFAAKRGFSQRNESEYDFFDDILDLSEMEPSQWSLNGNSVELSAPYSLLVREGQRVYLPEREEYVNGLPVLLGACKESPNGAIASFTDLNFAESIESFRAEDVQMTPDYGNVQILAEGVQLETRVPRDTASESVSLPVSFNLNHKLNNQWSVRGSVGYTPKLTLTVDYGFFEIHEFTYENRTTTSFSVTLDTKSKLVDKKEDTQSIKFARVPMISATVVSVWLEMSLVVTANGTVTFTSEISTSEKFTLKDGKISSTKSTNNRGVTISASVSLTLELKGALVVKVGFVELKTYADVAELALSFGCTVKGSISSESIECLDIDITVFLRLSARIGVLSAEVAGKDIDTSLAFGGPIFEISKKVLTLHYESGGGLLGQFVEHCTKSKHVTVTYYLGSPDVQFAEGTEISVERGAKLSMPNVPVRTGYLFKGWFKEPEFENEWNFDTDTVDGYITLYAKWILPWLDEDPSGLPTLQPGGPTATLPGGVTPTPAPTPTPSPTPPRLLTAEESLPYLKYEIGDDGVTITGYNDKPVMITVPDKIEGKTVIAIGKEAFYRCSSLLRIELPDCITTIGDSAFSSCNSLAKIGLPDGVTSIGNSAFAYSKLQQVNIPKRITSIGSGAFQNCPIASIDMSKSSSLDTIGVRAFFGCENLSNVLLPDGLRRIEGSAFSCCSALTQISLPDSITYMGPSAFAYTHLTSIRTPKNWGEGGTEDTGFASPFYDCDTLKHVEVPEGATAMAKDAFCMTDISSISLPSTLKTIGESAFENCSSLTQIALPLSGNLEEIGRLAFYKCTSLARISLPENLKAIGYAAFYNCSSLTQISLPDGLTTLGDNAFKDSGLEFVRTPKWGITDYSVSSSAFAGCASLHEVEVPEGATVIPESVFENTAIARASLPSTLKTIQKFAFRNCASLKQVPLSGDLEAIEESAFANCSSLTEASLPGKLKTIGKSAFSNCASLKRVYLPDGLVTLENGVFENSGLEFLRTPKWVEENYSIGENVIKGCNSLRRVEVPEGATIIPAYVFLRSTVADVSLPSTLKTIGTGAFASCASLKQVLLPAGLTTLEDSAFSSSGLEFLRTPKWNENYSAASSAFSGCKSLQTVEVPEGATVIPKRIFSSTSVANVSLPSTLKTIGAYAFSYCASLTRISLPDSITKIGKYAFNGAGLTSVRTPRSWSECEDEISPFRGCRALKSVEVPEGVTALPKYAFDHEYDTCNIENVQLPSTLKIIGECAFRGCKMLRHIELPDGITTIEHYAFYGSGLTSIRMPKSWGDPELNGKPAFYDCRDMKYVEIPEGVTTLPKNAFSGTDVESISLPSTLKTIGNNVFYSCKMDSLTIPKSVTQIGDEAFCFCKIGQLIFQGDIDLSHSIEIFGSYDPLYSPVERALLPRNAEKIKAYLQDVYPAMKIETLPSGINTLFWSNTGDSAIASSLVQAGRQIARPADPVWEGHRFIGWYRDPACSQPWDFANDVMPNESMTLYAGWDDSEGFIYDEFSYYCAITGYEGSATVLTIPSELNGKPVNRMNSNCIPDSVVRLTIPASVTNIYPDALRYASGLSFIEVADGNPNYHSRDGVLFKGDMLLVYPQDKSDERYAIPEGTTNLSEYAFYNCDLLRALEVPASVQSLGLYSIYDCDRLNSVSFEADVDFISTANFLLCGSSLNVTGPQDAAKLIEYADHYQVNYNVYRLIFVQDDTVRAALQVRAGTPLSALPAPKVAEGMAFLGWSTAEDGSEIWSGDGAVMPAEDVVLYSVERCPFEYEATGGGVRLTRYIGADGKVRIPESIEGSAVEEIAPGCFEGKQVTLVGDKGGLAERFAQAQGLDFEALSYALRFETNGGRSIAPQSHCATDAIELPTPVRTGYAFQAWCADAALTQRWTETAMPNRDLTLYALWKPTGDDAPEVPFTFEEEDGGVVITGYTGVSGRAVVPATINELPVAAIGAYAFQDNQFLREVELPASVKRVGEGAFTGSSLYSVAMPGVETIDASAFGGCDQLASVSFGAGLRTVGAFAFEDCSALLKLALPSGLTELGEGAFCGCTWLTSLELSDALGTIGADAFSGCSRLLSIRLGPNVSKVGEGAFDGCTALAAIEVDEGNARYFATDGVLFRKQGASSCYLVRYPEGKTDESYTTPERLLNIQLGAMQGARFRNLKIPNVHRIEENAMRNCTKLEKVEIHSDVSSEGFSINKGAMLGCINLREVHIDIKTYQYGVVPSYDDVTIRNNSFPPQKDLIIYSNCEAVLGYVRKDGYLCREEGNDGVVYVTGISIPEQLDLELGEEMKLTAELEPSETTETKVVWSNEDASIAYMEDGLVIAHGVGETTITATAMNGASASCLVRVTRKPLLAESIALSPEALKLRVGDMRSVAAIVLPTGAEDAAVTWSVEDPSIVDWISGCVIGKSTGQTTLTATTAGGLSASCEITVTDPEPVISMDAPDFLLPDSLTAIEAEAFKGLAMTVVRCPSDLREIGSRAFADCKALRQIYIPPMATSIAEDAFEGCGANLIIYGEYGTAAETYAEAHGYSFREMG